MIDSYAGTFVEHTLKDFLLADTCRVLAGYCHNALAVLPNRLTCGTPGQSGKSNNRYDNKPHITSGAWLRLLDPIRLRASCMQVISKNMVELI
jgi:hypothetical protein